MVTISEVQDVQDIDHYLLRALNDLIPQLKSSSKPATLDMKALQEIVSDPRTSLLIAMGEDDILVGCVVLATYRNLTKMRAWIESLVVDKSRRGEGIGEALCREAISRALDRRIDDINLTARPDRNEANELYLKTGFGRRETNAYRLVV